MARALRLRATDVGYQSEGFTDSPRSRDPPRPERDEAGTSASPKFASR